VFPALRIGFAAVSRGCEVLYVGSYRGIENQFARDLPFAFDRIHAEPVGAPLTPRGIKGLLKLARAQREAMHILDAFQPDVVFGTGGYAAAPVLMAQRKRGGPYVLHEQNAVAGRANRMMGKHAVAVCVVFEQAIRDFPKSRVIRTGMPLRDEAIQSSLTTEAAREKFGLRPDRWTVLVYGGSQGAQALNEAVLSTAKFMGSDSVQWLHVAGEKHVSAVRASAERCALNGNYVAFGFLEGADVGAAFRAADMAVTRCGSGTLNETLAWGLPVVMVPLPTAAANHQFHNARAVEHAGAGVLLRQSALAPAVLAEHIERWRTHPEIRETASANGRKAFVPGAAETILDLLAEAAEVPVRVDRRRKVS
jgi:UDP-N-acetylglucosamine--N-acetylmuramyl-(pentapeptide) pyrophosphoryl-undecaprenol N-acetylglucosamine transferase